MRKIFTAVAVGLVSILAQQALAQTSQPLVAANSDGSCIYQAHINLTLTQDVHLGNGETYHQQAVTSKRDLVLFPETTVRCKDGQLSYTH